MTEIPDCLKCPGCHRKGTMDMVVRKKSLEAQCRYCDSIVSSRVPYPKHRVDDDGYYLAFEVPSIRPIEIETE